MNQALVDRIVNAVLYEGYILYPYRPSVKNRQRWTFGSLYPPAYSEAQQGADVSTMQTQCLVQGGPQTRLRIAVRFLHLLNRQMGAWQPGDHQFRPVEALEIDGKRHYTWQEAVERQIDLDECSPAELDVTPRVHAFEFPAHLETEILRNQAGEPAGMVRREQHAIAGTIELSACSVGEGLFRVTVTINNSTALENARSVSRDEALLRALVSTHTILGVREGEFVSLLDPPDGWREAAAACKNLGAWPVLVGEEGQKDTMLSSPIILYDYPQVAPESPGDLFDGAEIDEILTLRILTLTDEEKSAVAAVDDRARALLQRTESLARDQLMQLHGTFRGASLPENGSDPFSGEEGRP